MVAEQKHTAFKQTEVGEIPVDWEVDEIQSVANITTGAKNTQDRISNGTFPFFVRSQIVERINSFSFDGEAVLTAGDGVGTGKVFHYINGKFDFHQRVYKISGFSEEQLDGYFFYLYFSQNFFSRIMQMTAKSSVDSVRREMIAKMLIPLPLKSEQIAIATALTDADALITRLDKLIAKKKAIKQGAMQELLRPKEGWEVKTLAQIGFLKNGVNKASFDFGHGYPFVNLMDVFGHSRISKTENLGLINSNEADRKLYDLKKGDVVFIRSSVKPEGVGLTCVVANDLVDTVFSGFIIRFRDSGFLSMEFKEYCFSTEDFRNRLLSSSTVSANTNINQEALKKLSLSFPKEKAEQTRIAQILSDMDTEIEKLEQQLAKQKMLKQGMMQMLLTGKIRLINT